MTQEQINIKNRVAAIEQELKELFDPTIMELNKKINALYNEWDMLQDKCEHIFENGKCVICGKEDNK